MARLAQAREETIERKLERAVELLQAGLPVSKVARKIEMGPREFRDAFKRKFRCTPREYRPRCEYPTVSFKLKSLAELHQIQAAAARSSTSVSAFLGRLVRRHLRLASLTSE